MQGIEGWGRITRLRGKVPRRVLYILGVLIFGAILYYGGIEALRQVAQANPFYLGCAFVAGGFAAFLTSARWGLIVNSLEGRVVHSRLHYFYYVMLGKISSLLVSQYVGDYGVRPLALKASSSTPLGKAFYSVLLDRLFDLILSVLFLVPTLLYLVRIISSEVMMLSILVFLGVYWVISARNHRILTDYLAAITRGVDRQKTKVPLMAGTLAKVVEIMQGASKGLEEVGQRCITSANFLTFGRYLAMVFRAYFVSLALNLTIPFSVLFVSVGIVRFSLLFAVAPGRLGVLEVGWYGVLALAGIESSQIIPLLIGLRVYGFLFNAVLALFTHMVVVALPRKRG
jgi:uncharacterized protein (TIRG00374 family)